MAKRYSRPRDDSARHQAERGAGLRGQRLEELFREELNSLLEIEINDPVLERARITRAELSLDGSRARVWFALGASFGDADVARTLAAFERAAGFLRSRLCDALPVKRIPELTFRYEPVVLPPDAAAGSPAEEE
ncbi:MAG TPA: ribosome-binding factor A [Polyangiaceae bacterium]|nr:ribosome-binding factor A [Polyangiaceae bacterium]